MFDILIFIAQKFVEKIKKCICIYFHHIQKYVKFSEEALKSSNTNLL